MNITLVGFMGTGKSIVGKHLAKRLKMGYIDLDEIIEKKENRPISQIFTQEGEEYFRRIENQVTEELSKLEGYVISTGGGVVLEEENVKFLRKKGVIVCLKAAPEIIWERTKNNQERPLLEGFSDKKKRIKELLKERTPFYNQADIIIDTSSCLVSQTVERIVKILTPEKLWVELGKRRYPVFIGSSIDNVGKIAQDSKLGEKILIVSDANVFPLYGKRVQDSLEKEGYRVLVFQISPGEKYKSLIQARKIYDFCLKNKLDRTSSILALGGGVVGDLAGFVAATFLRGVNFLIIPTTLLSQVDSGVGGKVGVDLPQGKNLVGAFYQPKFVLIDPFLLKTLSLRRIREGMAEVIKCAIIKNDGFFSYLEENISKVLIKDIRVFKAVINKAIKVKIGVVQEDEREEKGVRQILNLGHTIAHAIETVSKYGRYTHGEAVAIGMMGAAKIGVEMGIFSPDSFLRVKRLLKKAKLPLTGNKLNPQQIVEVLKVDKKMREGRLFFVLPQRIGKVCLRDDVPVNLVRKVVQELII